MPLTRPAVISDRVSLSDKLTALIAVRRFVSEDGAFNPLLGWDGIVDVIAPDKHGISGCSSKDNCISRTNEL
jgi:hypothetical protein